MDPQKGTLNLSQLQEFTGSASKMTLIRAGNLTCRILDPGRGVRATHQCREEFDVFRLYHADQRCNLADGDFVERSVVESDHNLTRLRDVLSMPSSSIFRDRFTISGSAVRLWSSEVDPCRVSSNRLEQSAQLTP